MKRIAKYKSFYDDGIFDDENEPKENEWEDDGIIDYHGRFETGPYKVDDNALLKRMEMLYTLMKMWQIPEYEFSAYLQRFIFLPKNIEANLK